MNKNKNENGFAHLMLILLVTGVLSLIGFASWRVIKSLNTKSDAKVSNTTKSESATNITAEAVLKDSKATVAVETVNTSAPTVTKNTTKTPTPVTSKPSATAAANCGGAIYNGTNTAFMGTETYLATKKFKAALEFAGLTSIVDGKNTVVFTMTDSIFDSLSIAQKEYMNLSPENMRSVLGWHIITSCQTYASVFKNATAPITLQTLNGPVTYTTSGHGKVEAAEIAIWDWFTINGAVHYITGFIKPPQI